MTCAEVERGLPEFLDDAPDVAIQRDFEAHLKSCPDCSDLVSDLKLISSEARQLATSEEPAPRVWARIAAELRAEGLTREPPSAGPILVPTSSGRRWSAWWLVPVAVALMAAGSYVISHKPGPEMAKQQAPATPVTSPAVTSPAPETPRLHRILCRPLLLNNWLRSPPSRRTSQGRRQDLRQDLR